MLESSCRKKGLAALQNKGEIMYGWAEDLFPICRSLTGDGFLETLEYIKDIIPELKIHEVPSGAKAFDWTVPDEWNIKDAFITDENGKRIIDFKASNLHVVGYSEPIDRKMQFSELDKNLHSLPAQPDAIPYITSYYKRNWGFCLTEKQRAELRKNPNATYHVKIDSTLAPGVLRYGEIIIPGVEEKEILLSTYCCHPSLANNELSGPVVTTALAQDIIANKNRRYSYRIIYIPETIGSIVYLAKNLEAMKQNTIAGFVVTCVGDDRGYSLMPSRYGNTIADKTARHVLKQHTNNNYKEYSFLERGSDERQYCSVGVDLPVCSIMRTKYGIYPEYHTSLDNLSVISPAGLEGAYLAIGKAIQIIENNYKWVATTPCEPQLGKRGLQPLTGVIGIPEYTKRIRNILAYADGTNDLIDLAEIIKENANDCIETIAILKEQGLLKEL